MGTTNGMQSRAVLGLLLIALGVMFLLETFDAFGTDTNIIGTYWPVLLIMWGIWTWAAAGYRATLGPIIIVAVGVFLLLVMLTDNGGRWWPIILIAIGVWFIYRRAVPAVKTTELSGAVNINDMFGGGDRRITGEFNGGQITAIFGGGSLDLREATMPAAGARVDVTVMFGGYELKVPETWNVVFRTTALFGGTNDERKRPPAAEGPSLTVTGTVLFGGFDVK